MYRVHCIIPGRKGTQVVAEHRHSVVERAMSRGGGAPTCTVTNVIKYILMQILDHMLLHRHAFI